MAELKYDKTGRLLFTKEMKEEYTILVPQMLPIHFEFIAHALRLEGFKVEVINTTHRGIVEQGLKHVHNDICFPAMLVIGQMIDALKSGKYDKHKIALMITQTGGGCRASNYIHLLRKGLKKAELEFIPVISLNLSGLEKNEGFKLNLTMIRRMIYGVVYGDLLMWLSNRCRAYEVNEGETDRLLRKWIDRISSEFRDTSKLRKKRIRENMLKIVRDFAAIPQTGEIKPRVGIVGEIYVKYAPLGNNNLERFLAAEGAEVIVPGLMDFLIFKTDNRVEDVNLYGDIYIKKILAGLLKKFLIGYQDLMRECIASAGGKIPVPAGFEDIKRLVKDYLGFGNKMGEGWLLTGEMLELIHSGVHNIVCTQPFGCLPNHIVGKGMIRAIRERHPESNIVAIDYDPGTAPANQENRLKLMLSVAKRALNSEPKLDIKEKVVLK
ncbi:MAG: 2-hydroxyglutaryl-CoA dehydratase [Eubacteriales bacterium]|jgi:predicted nucleotide-binding protein (sugar kinase/HSP70/actin superfamily)